jgi:hypothetical protein
LRPTPPAVDVTLIDRTNRHRKTAPGFLHRWVLPGLAPSPLNPALWEDAEERAKDGQNRIADAITAFAGSMTSKEVRDMAATARCNGQDQATSGGTDRLDA